MRKLFLILVAVMLFGGFCTYVMADSSSVENTEKIVLVNTGTTSQATAIATSASGDSVYIAPGKHRIVKMVVSNIAPGASTEVVAGLYDAASVGAATNTAIEGEIESNSQDSVTLEYSRPLKLVNGLTVIQGAYTSVLIEYERYRP